MAEIFSDVEKKGNRRLSSVQCIIQKAGYLPIIRHPKRISIERHYHSSKNTIHGLTTSLI